MNPKELAVIDQVHAANNKALDSLLALARNTSVLPDEGTAIAALNFQLRLLDLGVGQLEAMLCQLAVQVARGVRQ